MSASCSIAPDSRRSAMRGRLSSRVLDRAVQLGQGDHRHLELAGQRLEAPADLGDLLLPAVARVFGIDELDVIDEDQPDPAAAAHPPCAGGDLKHVPRGRIVDVHQAFLAQLVVGLAELRHFRMPEADAGPELVAVDPGSAQSRRSPISRRPISRLTKSTGVFPVDCNVFAMFKARAVLPMLGRAARTMSWPG